MVIAAYCGLSLFSIAAHTIAPVKNIDVARWQANENKLLSIKIETIKLIIAHSKSVLLDFLIMLKPLNLHKFANLIANDVTSYCVNLFGFA